ncbi:MAG: Hsp70 family protein [Janthinobacterium lividum]
MIIGIDLGTTNSLASVWHDGRASLVPNSLGKFLTPSVVSLDTTGEILVGEPARERLTSHPLHTVAAFKRSMGTGRSTMLGDRPFRPEELSSFVLRSLKADAEAFLGITVDEAVITVPAYFSDSQRQATRVAGELADLRVERLLNEPTAAALAYGLHEHKQGRDGEILVFDLGGGTFDVSVIDLFDGVIEVRATAGDNFLGGEDFDTAIMSWFARTTGLPMPEVTDPEFARLSARLRNQAETARRGLSVFDQVQLRIDTGGRSFSAMLDAEGFMAIGKPLFDRLRQPVARALADSRIRVESLAAVVLVGGATRMPSVRRLAATLFGRLPLQTIDPDQAVALGAAVQAGLKMRDIALDDVVLTDVAPYTLGIEVVEGSGAGRLLPVIERNTVVPVSRTQTVSPVADFQRRVVVRIYQGESRLVKDNIRLGDLTLELAPRRSREQEIEIRFTYDINGLLEVTARSMVDNVMERVLIEQHAGVLSAEQVKERLVALAPLKLAPRDAASNRLLLARAERLHEASLGNVRKVLADATSAFDAALESQDSDKILIAAAALSHAVAAAESPK